MDYQTAVLEGCKLLPKQAHKCWFEHAITGVLDYHHTTSACVNGAALAGFLNSVEEAESEKAPYSKLRDAFPVLEKPASCPECADRALRVIDLTIHLNDWHGWTRERIAQFVADL